MSGHTPGPWHIGQGNGEGSVFSDSGRMRLEEGGTTLYPVCKVFDFAGELEANARLIAAAPDLLEALKACHDWASGGYHEAIPGDLLRKASDAIDRAEGGAH